MTAERLSPAMRNVLFHAIRRGQGRPLVARTFKLRQTVGALRQRGLLDAENRPTDAGHAVFATTLPDGEVRRPGIEKVIARVRVERPNWSDAHVAAHAKYLYTTRGVRC